LRELDAGEVEAIVHAKDCGASLILLDDSIARSSEFGDLQRNTIFF